LSKSKNNGIDPQAQIAQYGADKRACSRCVRVAARADAGMVGQWRRRRTAFCANRWRYAQALRDVALAAGKGNASVVLTPPTAHCGAISTTAAASRLRLEAEPVQIAASACMKTFNTMGVGLATGSGCAAERLSILLRLFNWLHITHVLWQELGLGNAHGDIQRRVATQSTWRA
jgi:leucyl-tRNA synthetase